MTLLCFSFRNFVKLNNKTTYFLLFGRSFSAMAGVTQINNKEIAAAVSSIVPPLTNTAHKGQAGRIGIVGGSLEYTGAPYFSATTVLRCGADLAHVFCSREAAGPIKAYSPELIVHPVLDGTDPMAEMEEWLPRLHALLLGPGLGRRPQTFSTLQHIVQSAMDKKMLLVFDADALFYLNDNFDVLKNYKDVILTPNVVEFARLYRGVFKEDLRPNSVNADHVKKLANSLHVTILCKGQVDLIAFEDTVITCDVPGAPRRCGGQGDILSGAVALLYYWAQGTLNATPDKPLPLPPSVLASWGAAALTRSAMSSAFAGRGRSTLTSDVVNTLGQSFSKLFGK